MRLFTRAFFLISLFALASCGRTDLSERFVNGPDPDLDAGIEDTGGHTVDGGIDGGDGGLPESCSDEIQNGDETDVDCGGDVCEPCDEGRICIEDDDCVEVAFCDAGICVPRYDLGETCERDGNCLSDQCEDEIPGDFCTADCPDGACPGEFVCYLDRCVPDDYCEDVDGDGEPDGPGCEVSGCDDCDENASCVTSEEGEETCVCEDGYSGNGVICSDVDECADPITCGRDAICANEPGSFTCSCPPGFDGDPDVICNDIDECANDTDNCSPSADCTNERGGFDCECRAGFTGDGVTCTDVDECADGTAGCDTNASCINRPGGFECRCDPGFMGDGFMCAPDGSCGGDTCSPDATCATQPDGTQACVCNPGFTGDGQMCSDIDECSNGTDNCAMNAICTNVPGSFDCDCLPGYAGDGTTCSDIDECADGTAGCSMDATCTNLPGSYDCACNPGFSGDGFMCTPTVTCSDDPTVCDPNASCQADSTGTFGCVCDAGYMGDGFVCVDIDECANGTNNCDPNAVCTNTPGSFMCSCPMGFTGDGLTCTDIDECADGTDNCDPLAACANTIGSFTCTCPAGYAGDGTTCADINECAAGTDDCGLNATCTNTPGSYTCACAPGTTLVDGECRYPGDTCTNGFLVPSVPFFGSGDTRGSTDDYSYGAGDCGGFAARGDGAGDDVWVFTPTQTATYQITVTDQSWNSSAYILTDCTDTTSCVAADAFDPSISIVLQAGTTYYIVVDSASNSGFFRPEGPYQISIDLNECVTGTDNCDANATCSNDPVGFTCTCNTGYTGDGVTCNDINECTSNADNCSPNATCTNTPGSFDCTCDMGFTGDGVTCVNINGEGETCANPNVVSSLPYTYSGDTSLRADDYSVGFNECTGINGGGQGAPDEVFAFTPTVDGSYSFSVDGAFVRVVYLVTDCSNIATTCMQGDLGFGTGDATITTALNAGTTYYFIVDGLTSFSEGTFTIDVTQI